MSIKKILFTLTIVASSFGLKSQSETQELYPIFDFEEKKGQWVSSIFTLAHSKELSFVGVSAYESLLDKECYYQYRTSHDGEWSNWVDFTHTIDNQLLDRRIFEAPPLIKPFEEIQFSSIYQNSFPTIRLFFGFVSSRPNYMESKSQEEECSCELPAFCSRDCWCPEDNCQPIQSPMITQPSHIIVHHSAGFNTSTNFAAVVAYYYDLHVNTNGWDDIGYNWLVDPNGIIYEGRGSLAQGAHFSCMNGNTTGICMIGDFSSLSPTDEALLAMENLVSWELCDKDLDPLAITLHSNSELLLPTISGHRDGNTSLSSLSCASGTVCPGDVLYNMLEVERINIANNECLDFNISIDENELYDQYIIHPNPFHNSIAISSDNNLSNEHTLIQIFDIYGKLVFKKNIFKAIDLGENIPLKNLASGMYLLQISSVSNKETHRIIKK